ncbi:uncharacterized protein PFL1_01823 [Pseudozyma flocculosa PF-1]|nr:uncharacterized protein PFL1_01823 [Pseudozyma flocculosa PF-1]EPQ30925.1 hypothetical protein PFL1_01823 [Pseudozyma flocculosa PF-1]
MNAAQLDADSQPPSEPQMDDQEPPDDTKGPVFGRPDPAFAFGDLQDAAKLFLTAQQSSSAADLSATLDHQSQAPGTGVRAPAAAAAAAPVAPGLPRKASDGTATRSHKHKWSQEETQALVDGCNKHGVGNWKKILSDPELSGQFSDRTAGDLKDRFRTYFPDTYHELYPNAKTHLSKAVRGKDAEGKSIFEKGKTKERRPFSADEDAALKRGYLEHGSHWALIAKDAVFQNQRRAIDLRDRFRNAFPEDYERAGFKPRLARCKKDRVAAAAAAAKADDDPATGPRSTTLPFAFEAGAVSDGMHAEYGMSDASDGHLTDHGSLTDGNESGLLLGRPTREAGAGAGAFLGRSNSLGAAFRAPRSKLQQSTSSTDDVESEPPLPHRPQLVSANTLPLSASIADPHRSLGGLFEQLRATSINSTASHSTASSVHGGRNTSPSESEGAVPGHGKAASAEESSRCHAGKPKDATSHKRRSHSTRTGKSSALERMPSLHGHALHGHGHGHGHSHAHGAAAHHGHGPGSTASRASSALGTTERPHLPHMASNESSCSEASWAGYDVASSTFARSESEASNSHDVAMDVDEPISIDGSLWPGQHSATSDISAASLNTPRSSIYSQIDYPNLQMWSNDVAGQTAQAGVVQHGDQTKVHHDGSVGGRMSEIPPNHSVQGPPARIFAAQQAADHDRSRPALPASQGGAGDGPEQRTELGSLSAPNGPVTASRSVWSSAMDAFLDPLQDLLDPLGPSPGGGGGGGNGWLNGWSFNANEPARGIDETPGILSSTPLSHHKWAGDLHLRNYSVANLNALFDSMPDFDGGANLPADISSGQQSAASSHHSRSASVLDDASAASAPGDRPEGSADLERGRMMSLEPQERALHSASASWSPARRRPLDHGPAATNPCPTPPVIGAGLHGATRRLSDPAAKSVQELLEAASFSLDASLGLDSAPYFPALAESSFGLRRKRSNDTLRNTDGVIGDDGGAGQMPSTMVGPTDGAPAMRPPPLPPFNAERRNSVPAMAMLGQGTVGGAVGEAQSLSGTAGAYDGSLSILEQLGLPATAIDSSYAASLPDVSGAPAHVRDIRPASQQQHHHQQQQHHQPTQLSQAQAQPQQTYSYDDIDLAALADLDRSPARLYAEAQEIFNQLGQLSMPWSTSGLDAAGGRPAQGQSHQQATTDSSSSGQPATAASDRGVSFEPAGLDLLGGGGGGRHDGGHGSHGAAQLPAMMATSPAVARSASVSHVEQRPQVVRGLLSQDAASTTITAPTLLGAPSGSMASTTASLWASSGSLDRLEHLYLEGLHSSPSLAAASPVGSGPHAANNAGGAHRPGWMLSGANELGSGYLSE